MKRLKENCCSSAIGGLLNSKQQLREQFKAGKIDARSFYMMDLSLSSIKNSEKHTPRKELNSLSQNSSQMYLDSQSNTGSRSPLFEYSPLGNSQISRISNVKRTPLKELTLNELNSMIPSTNRQRLAGHGGYPGHQKGAGYTKGRNFTSPQDTLGDLTLGETDKKRIYEQYHAYGRDMPQSSVTSKRLF